MKEYSKEAVYQAEKAYMEEVYQSLKDSTSKKWKEVLDKKERVDKDACDDDHPQYGYAELGEAHEKNRKAEFLYKALYKKPYYAHLEVINSENNQIEHYYLSDCNYLDAPKNIGEKGMYGELMPFSSDTPFMKALLEVHVNEDGEMVEYESNGSTYKIKAQYICDDNIDSEKLLDTHQSFPNLDKNNDESDEYLSQLLFQYKNDPKACNIIATLQKEQVRLLNKSIKESFVVQGCAGSGKSQCLLHRMFYMRLRLDKEGWEHVVMITPTQLFREYTKDLVKKYRLTQIENCSIVEFYKTLITNYSKRIIRKEYYLESTEEYLPDLFLQEIYSEDILKNVKSFVEMCTRKYALEACKLLHQDEPQNTIEDTLIDSLVQKLTLKVKEIDEYESILVKDSEYVAKRREYEILQKKLEKASIKYKKVLDDSRAFESLQEQYLTALKRMKNAKEKRDSWNAKRTEEISEAKKELQELENLEKNSISLEIQEKIQRAKERVQELTKGNIHLINEAVKKDLEIEYKKELHIVHELSKNQSEKRIAEQYDKKETRLITELEKYSDEVKILSNNIKQLENWFDNRLGSISGKKIDIFNRNQIVKFKNNLQNLADTIFEKDLYPKLTDLKEKYGIATTKVMGKNKKEMHILYKSDLLFYLKICILLKPKSKIPDYRYICIDEGQDLNKADYDMIKSLYPNAIYNIYGDINQVLHLSCGITDWKTETGIEKVYEFKRNYRNLPGLTKFCNEHFGSNMKYIKSKLDNPDQYIHICKDIQQLRYIIENENIVIVVKNKNVFLAMCQKTGNIPEQFGFIDSNIEEPTKNKIPCYSIYAAKGIEFNRVLVYADGMTRNQKLVACTRARYELYYME